jgi:hypothetical protein
VKVPIGLQDMQVGNSADIGKIAQDKR